MLLEAPHKGEPTLGHAGDGRSGQGSSGEVFVGKSFSDGRDMGRSMQHAEDELNKTPARQYASSTASAL